MFHPMEVKTLLHGWDFHQKNQTMTIFGTYFRFVPAVEAVMGDQDLAKGLIARGVPFYIELAQEKQHYYQSSDTLYMNAPSIAALKIWIEKEKYRHSFVHKAYDAD